MVEESTGTLRFVSDSAKSKPLAGGLIRHLIPSMLVQGVAQAYVLIAQARVALLRGNAEVCRLPQNVSDEALSPAIEAIHCI